jgi:arylsulfatase A-like enzyme
MVSSDNGSTFAGGGSDTDFFNSTGGLRGRKTDLYEGGISVPLIVRWPGKVQAGVVSELVSAQYDLFATLSELTGVESGWKTDGISFLPALLGQAGQQTHKYIYFEFPEKTGQVAIIKEGRWKGVKSRMKSSDGIWEIFDLQNDRRELFDLSAQQADLIPEFEAVIQKEHWQATVREWEFINPKFN